MLCNLPKSNTTLCYTYSRFLRQYRVALLVNFTNLELKLKAKFVKT